MVQRSGGVSRTATSMRLTRTGFLRTSRTTLPSSVSSTMGYHAPRRSTSATLSRQRAHPRGVGMKGANVAHPAKLRYAHDRYRHPSPDPTRLPEARREAHPRLRSNPPAGNSGAARLTRRQGARPAQGVTGRAPVPAVYRLGAREAGRAGGTEKASAVSGQRDERVYCVGEAVGTVTLGDQVAIL